MHAATSCAVLPAFYRQWQWRLCGECPPPLFVHLNVGTQQPPPRHCAGIRVVIAHILHQHKQVPARVRPHHHHRAYSLFQN